LPFTCDSCQRIFCLEHFRYEDHGCTLAAGKDNRVLVCPLCQEGIRLVPTEDANVTWERHCASGCKGKVKTQVKRCPVAGCREELTVSNRFDCKRCNQRVCLKHRFEDTHTCATSYSSSGQARSRQGWLTGAAADARRRAGTAGDAIARAGAASTSIVATSISKAAPMNRSDAGQKWQCGRCTLENAKSAKLCSACGAVAPQYAGQVWPCPKCTLENKIDDAECLACGEPRPKQSECSIS